MAGPTPQRRVLVVEDDASIRELLRLHLDLAGFTIDEAGEGRSALETARATPFDLVLLDVMLPGLDGVSVCRAIRNGGPNVDTPILMLTAREGESDKVLGLESGADDYLTKPFGVRELMARIGALMRRHQRHPAEVVPSPMLDTGELSLDRERRTATVRGGRIELTKQEFDLLYLDGVAAGCGVHARGAAARGLERRHLRHRSYGGHGDQQAAPQDRARPSGSGAAAHGLGCRLQVRRLEALANGRHPTQRLGEA